jgi:CRISPR-associated protein Csx3
MRKEEPPMKVIVCGPPHSGKSCLRFGLKEAIKALPEAPYPYVITACPDGEGSWFQEAASENPDLAAKLKQEYKGKFTDEFAEVIGEWVKNCQTALTLIDIGGVADPKNERICAHATHAIILTSAPEHLTEWRRFCEKLKLLVIAEVHSDYAGTTDSGLALGSDGIYRGSVHHLERGDLSVRYRPTVIQLAKILAAIATPKEA